MGAEWLGGSRLCRWFAGEMSLRLLSLEGLTRAGGPAFNDSPLTRLVVGAGYCRRPHLVLGPLPEPHE